MKKLLTKIKGFFALVFGGAKKFETFLIDHVDDAIAIVSKIKQAVENPVIITLIGFLPEKYKTVGGAIIARIESVLDKVLQDLVISNQCLQQPTTAARLKCFIDNLKKLSPAAQEALYMKFASLYAAYSSGSEESRSRIDTAVQMRFLEQKENLV
jgi:hypothetical protein